jgi:hypothetical protein
VIGKHLYFKECSIPEYDLGRSVEFLGEAWKNQGLGLALSEKTYNQNIIKTPMCEGYHP